MTRLHLRGAICHRAPQPSRPSLSGGIYYVTPSPCEDERVVSVTQAFPCEGVGLSSAQETGENRTAVPEAVTMSMPLSVPSVS